MLIVFAGLPGTGKTTLARAVATHRRAAYLRIDVIEQAIRDASPPGHQVGPAGYAVAQALALANLRLGASVVADCVNPVPESRTAWQRIAQQAPARLVEIELRCSDPAEHRRRIETRHPDIENLVLPSWQNVLDRPYAPWPEPHQVPHLVLDTATLSEAEALAAVQSWLGD